MSKEERKIYNKEYRAKNRERIQIARSKYYQKYRLVFINYQQDYNAKYRNCLTKQSNENT